MKKLLLLLALGLLAGKTVIFSQEIIVGGNMEDANSWHFSSRTDKTDIVEATFNYTLDIPTDGSGGCLELTGMGDAESYTWQKVSIVPGHKYTLSGFLKSISTETVTNTWAEVFFSRNKPDSSKGYGAGTGDYWYTNSTWKSAPYGNFDGLDGALIDVTEFIWDNMKVDGQDSILTSSEITIPDTVSVTDWYVVIKTGCWNATGSGPTFDFLFDNISLNNITIVSDVAQVTNGNNFSIFPNPSNGIINIKSSGNSQTTKYGLYNVAGVLVKSGNVTNQLDLTSLGKGTYIIKLGNNSSTEFHKLVLK
jgi:hypothetical protein